MGRSTLIRCLATPALVVLVPFALACGGTTTAVSNHLQEQITFSSSRALDGSDAANLNSARNIWVVNDDGTGAKPLTPLTVLHADSDDPAWSPDGTRIAFASARALDGSDAPDGLYNVWIVKPDGTGATPLTTSSGPEGNMNDSAAWSPDKYKIAFLTYDFHPGNSSHYLDVINADGSGLIDLARFATGAPVWSPDGTQVLYTVEVTYSIIWVADLDGTGGPLTDTHFVFAVSLNPTWSPDGTKIAFASNLSPNEALNSYPGFNIWVMNADGSSAMPLTTLTSGAGSGEPTWSPDGTKILFSSSRALDGSDAANPNSTANVWIMNADGTGAKPLTLLTASGAGTCDAVWSPDGTKIAFDSARALDGSDAANSNVTTNIWVMNADGTGAKPVAPITAANAHSRTPQWQP